MRKVQKSTLSVRLKRKPSMNKNIKAYFCRIIISKYYYYEREYKKDFT